MTTVQEKIISILSQEFERPPAEIKLTTSLAADLGMDSIDAVEIATMLEEAFHIEISDVAAEHFGVVADLVSFVNRQVQAPEA